jgi:hypothetical protein
MEPGNAKKTGAIGASMRKIAFGSVLSFPLLRSLLRAM